MTGAGSAQADTVLLSPHPTSVRAAREHVAAVLGDSLPELAETASLLVSEVVTNALLHAGTDIDLWCRVEGGSLRVRVRDGSSVTPSPRHYDAGAMTGRGLGLVELLAAEWGVDTDDGGKTVWFVLAGPHVVGGAAPSSLNERSAVEATFVVHLLGLPPDLALATIEYGDAVLREHALLTIGAASGRARGSAWPTPAIDLGPLLGQAAAAQEAGRTAIDVVLDFPVGAGPAALERLALVDEADRLAQEGELLTPAAVPEVGACRRWLFGQIGLQAEGVAPVGWSMPEPAEPAVGPVCLPDEEVRRLDGLRTGTIVADDANRILYVNPAAAALLGWADRELVGRRLVTIVPPELRGAHLAGFTRYLLTGEARLLGRRARLPALCRDGSVVQVDLSIEMADLDGRQVFRAELRAAEE